MTQQSITKSSPGSALFPEYGTLYDLIASEVASLSDERLDFASDRWECSRWSIRTQLSHMASLIYRWLLIRWGDFECVCYHPLFCFNQFCVCEGVVLRPGNE